jgi:glycosyltransferase involved in cell wall biosynthesis
MRPESRIRPALAMIHYITPAGLHDAWVGNEIHAVTAAGIPVALHAMRRAERDLFHSPWAESLRRGTRVLYPIPPTRLATSLLLAPLLFRARFFAALANALVGERESLGARLAALGHLGVACDWARSLRREPVSHVHSQWIHACGSVGMYGAWLLGTSFSFTGHATDLFRARVALRDKIRRAEFIVCISTFHRDFYLSEGARPAQLVLAYCGIDTALFAPRAEAGPGGQPFRILAAGRLVEKKGFVHLIEACRRLADRGREFRCEIGGGGELLAPLRARVAELGLGERVRLRGEEIRQEDLPRFLAGGDLFCLPCVRAADGDVDGLPQLLMEAMACGLPVLSSRLAGIPDLVIDGETGLLCAPGRPDELAAAIERLMDDRALATRLAQAGRRFVRERFDIARCLDPLIARFRAKLGAAHPGPHGRAAPAGARKDPESQEADRCGSQ